jgi:hypothetical protein
MQLNNSRGPQYLLTIIQHTYCSDCMWLKGKITDVYHASGIVRGDDSMHWRVQILSPPWDREDRAKEFPTGFASVDVPALKLECDNRILLATQSPGLISEILQKLKWLLINRKTNLEIRNELQTMKQNWVESPDQTVCAIS